MQDQQQSEPQVEFGEITFKSAAGEHTAKYDRIAVAGNTLSYISIISEPTRVKAIRAMLHNPKAHAVIHNGDAYPKTPDGQRLPSKYGTGRRCDATFDSEARYASYAHKVSYGMVHAVFCVRDPFFMAQMTPDSVWERLKSKTFTTPLMHDWLPYLVRELIESNHLEAAACYRMTSGYLRLRNSKKLDKIVTRGLVDGHIFI